LPSHSDVEMVGAYPFKRTGHIDLWGLVFADCGFLSSCSNAKACRMSRGSVLSCRCRRRGRRSAKLLRSPLTLYLPGCGNVTCSHCRQNGSQIINLSLLRAGEFAVIEVKVQLPPVFQASCPCALSVNLTFICLLCRDTTGSVSAPGMAGTVVTMRRSQRHMNPGRFPRGGKRLAFIWGAASQLLEERW